MTQKRSLSPLVAALMCAGIASPAIAGEAIKFDNGMTLDWRVNSTYTLSTRLESRDHLLSGTSNPGGNDGNNNFDRGSLTANRLSFLLDAHLFKGETGLVMSASTFYDDVYHRSNDNTFPVNKRGDVDEFTSDAKKYHGGYSRILDLYGYTSFGVGEEGRATVRLGSHAVSWGEALFLPGIALAQGPADGTKTGIPGTETKDQLLPEDQISAQYEVNDKWSILAHAQYGWHKTIAQAPGAFLSTGDSVGPGASCLQSYVNIPAVPALGFAGYNGCSFGRRGKDIRPDDTGQWGIGTRFRITDETELGLYYLNYHDRTPLPEINAFTPPVVTLPPAMGGAALGRGSYRIRYFDDIKLIGASFSTMVGIAAVAGEVSYKQGAPALVNTVIDPRTGASLPTPTRADVMQTNLNTFINFGRTFLAPQTLFLGEFSYVDVSRVESRKAMGVEALGPAAAFFPESSDLTFANHGLAFSSTLTLTYPGIAEGLDLAIPISYAHQLKGRTLLGGVGGEGDRRLSIGANFTYQRNLQIGLTYLGYLGSASLDPIEYRPLTDRDQLSLVVKYSF